MKLLADEGVDKPIVDKLRQIGFDVHYILETSQGADDDKVLGIANQEGRILLTQDKDFGELVYRMQKNHHGIILIRLGDKCSSEKAIVVTNILSQYKDSLANTFTVIQTNAIRIRK
jgi:predicted nuclease of predicted toxin-antitoxin system